MHRSVRADVSAAIGAREAFLLDPSVAFVNHGSFGAVPKPVLAAQTAWRERCEREPVRFFMDDAPKLIRAVAERLGALVGADGAELAWVDNATTGANAVLGSLPLQPGDAIVATTHGYAAVNAAIRHHASRAGARLIEAQVPFPIAGPQQVVDAIAAVLDDRTRLVVVDHVTSFSGLVFPVHDVVRLCHARAIPVLVDGAHAPGMLPLDLRALDADWYVGNCHKWLFAPKGCAFLHARADRQANLHPAVISHGYGLGYLEEFDWTGTRDPSAWLALGASLDFVEERGLGAIQSHNNALAAEAGAMLSGAWDTPLPAPASMRAALVTLPIRGDLPATWPVARAVHDALLRDHGVQVPVWMVGDRLWLRISAQIYNRADDYRRLAAALPTVSI